VPLVRARGGASQEGLVSLLGAERMRPHFVVAVAIGPALRAGTSLLRISFLFSIRHFRETDISLLIRYR
jgi:hypothetical protein